MICSWSKESLVSSSGGNTSADRASEPDWSRPLPRARKATETTWPLLPYRCLFDSFPYLHKAARQGIAALIGRVVPPYQHNPILEEYDCICSQQGGFNLSFHLIPQAALNMLLLSISYIHNTTKSLIYVESRGDIRQRSITWIPPTLHPVGLRPSFYPSGRG